MSKSQTTAPLRNCATCAWCRNETAENGKCEVPVPEWAKNGLLAWVGYHQFTNCETYAPHEGHSR